MTGLLTQLRTVAEELNYAKAKWALVGALAVSVYTEPRTTRDIDVAIVFANEDERKKFVEALLSRGFHNQSILMHMAPTHKLGTRLQIPVSSGSSIALDLLHCSSGIEAEIVKNAVSLEIFPKLIIPVANIGHLIAMKILSQNDSDRIKDRDDLQRLLKVASKDDLSLAKRGVQLIQERGFNRGLDLLKMLAEFLN